MGSAPAGRTGSPGRRRGSKAGQGIRTFLAVELGEPARRAAAELAAELARGAGGESVRWVRPEAYHVTVRFLGSVQSDAIPPLVKSVTRETGAVPPFMLGIGAARLFPNTRRPHVVVLDLQPEAPLRALAERVERAVVQAGFPPEERCFRAHLTLGRVRSPGVPKAIPEQVPQAPPFPVREVVLFRSDLRSTGAVYTPLEHIALGGTDSPGTRTSKGEEHGEE